MKKLIALTLASTITLGSATAHAGLVDEAMTSGWPVKPTTKYKLDMYGFNARAYEFRTDNGMRCVAVFPGGTAVGWQLQCLPN